MKQKSFLAIIGLFVVFSLAMMGCSRNTTPASLANPAATTLVQPQTGAQSFMPQKAGYYDTVWPSEHTDLWWAASSALAYGPIVTMLRPPELRRMVGEWAQGIVGLYQL